MPKTPSTVTVNPTLLAFKPRQVLLSKSYIKHNNAMDAAKALSAAPGNGSREKFTLEMDQKTHLLHSVAQFLERNGLSKSLKKFRSEAQIEKDVSKSSSLDLEEMYYNYLQTCNHGNASSDLQKAQDTTHDISKIDTQNNIVVMETASKKKKRRDKVDCHSQTNQLVDSDATENVDVKSKEKKKSRKNSDPVCDQAEQLNVELSKETANNSVRESLLEDHGEKCKEKRKKKSKLVFESNDHILEQQKSESLCGENLECPVPIVSTKGKSIPDGEAEKKSKDKKKKRSKLTSDLVDDSENHGLEDKQGDGSLNTDVSLCEGKALDSKTKKKTKAGLVPESLSGNLLKELNVGNLNGNDSDFKTSGKDENDKSSKKRKRLTSEGHNADRVDEVTTEDNKRRKLECEEECKRNKQPAGLNASLDDCKIAGEECRGKSDQVNLNESQKTPVKHLNGKANENIEKDGEKSSLQKTKKKQTNGSAEPKTVNAFQRVKVDHVVFADQKLEDNSYWAKDGAEIGYGAKAQEVLGQVRGRDFRHEKTKKKRGSYRGGMIDLQSHSVKFNYSDDE